MTKLFLRLSACCLLFISLAILQSYENISDAEDATKNGHDSQISGMHKLETEPSELVSDLASEDAVARFMAEEQLVKMGDAAVPALEPLATSSGFALARQYALNILARVESERAIRLLLHILEQEPDVKVRALICRHLGRLGVEEAVPIIGKWLFTIQGKSFNNWKDPQVMTTPYAWIVHVYTLREIGSEKGIPILETMLTKEHGGKVARDLKKVYQQNLNELKREAAFWNGVRQVPGLEKDVKLLFRFFRRDTLALIRLYRDKVLRLGIEGRWVLEGMKNHPNEKLRGAATAVLKNYDKLKMVESEE